MVDSQHENTNHRFGGTPSPPAVESHRVNSSGSAGPANNNNTAATTAAADVTRQPRRRNPLADGCRRCLPEFLRDRYERQYFILVIMTSPVWRFLVCLCILLLLFGAQVQNLWCDPSYDTMFDILYTIAFGVFVLDISMRILVVPGYIGFKYKTLLNLLARTFAPRKFKTKNESRRNYYDHGDRWSNIHIGSFLFWCDVVSALSILYEISYINQMQTRVRTVDIELDSFGIPVCVFWNFGIVGVCSLYYIARYIIRLSCQVEVVFTDSYHLVLAGSLLF